MKTQVLLYGGSFDPPHRGHVIPVMQVAMTLQSDHVIYMPCATPPQSKGRQLSNSQLRANMLQKTLEHYWNLHRKHTRAAVTFEVSENEIRRGDKSFTFETVRELDQASSADKQIRLLIGADQAANFHTWKEADALEALTDPIVMMRPPWNTTAIYSSLPDTWSRSRKDAWISRVVPAPLVDISSTELRQQIANAQWDHPMIQNNIAPAVIQILKTQNPYIA